MEERLQISESSLVWKAPLTKDGHAVEVRTHNKPITSTIDATGAVPSGKLSLLDPTGKVIKIEEEPVSLAHALFIVHEEDFEIKGWIDKGLEMLGELPKSA